MSSDGSGTEDDPIRSPSPGMRRSASRRGGPLVHPLRQPTHTAATTACSAGGHAAIDHELAPGYPSRFIRCEIHATHGDVIGRTEPAQRCRV